MLRIHFIKCVKSKLGVWFPIIEKKVFRKSEFWENRVSHICQPVYTTTKKCSGTKLPPCHRCGIVVCKQHAEIVVTKYEVTCKYCGIRDMLLAADK